MPYTLTAGLLWFAAALIIGVCIGVLVRSVTARRQVARARAGNDDLAELERLRGRVAELDALVAEREAERDALRDGLQRRDGSTDVTDAAAVLGHAVVLDDLTAVEGLGAGVQELCHGIGIRTWRDLGETEVSLLRTMLDDAGARYQVHDPTTWPTQARLLAEGRWAEFREVAESVRSRPTS